MWHAATTTPCCDQADGVAVQANENCVLDDSGASNGPMLQHNMAGQAMDPQAEQQHSMWYDMATGETYSYKAPGPARVP